MSALPRLRKQNAMIQVLSGTLIALFVVLTLDVLWGVVSRYLLGQQSRFTEELAIYLLVWVSLLGAPVAYAEHAHLGVDYVADKLDPVARRLARALVELTVGAFSAIALVYGGIVLVRETLDSGQTSPALALPMAYVYAVTPLSGACLLLQCVVHLRLLLQEHVDPVTTHLPATDAQKKDTQQEGTP